MSKIYIAGPMTRCKGWNYDNFARAEAALRLIGLDVVNPATLHDEDEPGGKEWHEYLRTAITALVTCDLICLLPGVSRSEGAQLEMHIAAKLGIHTLNLDGDLMVTLEPEWVNAGEEGA